MPSIASTFANLRARRQIGLVPFIPAGYPDLKLTQALLPALVEGGASVIEIGIPFSDPIADGPTIQAAFTDSLAKGLKVADIFAAIAQVRSNVAAPLVAMVSYSIVFRYGLEKFVTDARIAGFDGLILPDLPPPEAQSICAKVQAGGLESTLLIAPTTSPQRRKVVAELSSGFIYYLSVSGITGERAKLPENIETQLRDIRSLTSKPVCVGFGISTAEHVKQLAPLADGAIVGSAIVKRITAMLPAPYEKIAAAVREYCRELLSQVR